MLSVQSFPLSLHIRILSPFEPIEEDDLAREGPLLIHPWFFHAEVLARLQADFAREELEGPLPR